MRKYFYISIFFISSLIYLTTMNGYFDIPDTVPSLKTAKSIMEKGRLYITVGGEKGYITVGDADTEDQIFIYFRAKDGKIYSKYGLFTAIYMIPFILLGRLFYQIAGPDLALSRLFFEKFAISSMNCFPTALACVFLAKLARRMRFSFSISFILSMFFGLCTMAWHYADATFSEPLLALELLGAVYYIFKTSETKRMLDIAIAALFVGLLMFTKAMSFIVIPVLAIYALYTGIKNKDKKFVVTFFSIVAVFAALLAWFNFIRFGSIFETGYGREATGFRVGNSVMVLVYKIFRHLFSLDKGFFIYNPILLASLFALRQYYKKEKVLFFVTLGMSSIYIITLSLTRASQFESWGPRYFLILVPFFILPIGYLLEKRKKLIYCIIAFLFVFSFLLNLASVLVSHTEYVHVKMQWRGATESPFIRAPSDIKGIPIMLKNKLFGTDGVYSSDDFGATKPGYPPIIVTTYNYDRFKGLNLWYSYLERKIRYKKAKAFPFITIPIIIVLIPVTLVLAKRLDKNYPSIT